ncbi:MAG: methylated-DNA--[protein]-cysteine S-methyltransferase [Thermoplasmata archaeon]|nr:methylated-DNA--[protein]-cysteine S-methyltransferase [Thermoplasmata archaeon]
MSEPLECADVPTPIGTFRILYRGRTVRVVDLLERGLEQSGVPEGVKVRRPPFPAGSAPRQLSEYFRGKRTTFELEPQTPGGSAFDAAVWAELCRVPAGETVTYGELARRAGHPGSARAVGGAMHRNPIPIIIPCHRVVGETGSLTGFGLGLWRKRWLLDREGAWPLRSKTPEGPRDPAQRTLDGRSPRGPRAR